jgi:hypothetical protein
MEIDCDARVLRAGVDANDYGLALLYVSEQQIRAPHASLALIERTSQLERRIQIMVASPRKLPALFAGACFTLAVSCVVVAAQIDAPAMATAALSKPPPAMGLDSPGFRLGQRFEMLLREQYPDLLEQKFAGTPVVVALVNSDWSIERSARTLVPEPIESMKADKRMFGILGLADDDIPYVGMMNMKQPKTDQNILMLYTERKTPGIRFISSLFPDTRAADRAIFRQNFAGRESIPAGERPWVLLDRSGKVLRSGVERTDSDSWLGQFQQRYGVRTQEFTVTPLTREDGEPLLDQGGKELQLNTLWLAAEPPAPQN